MARNSKVEHVYGICEECGKKRVGLSVKVWNNDEYKLVCFLCSSEVNFKKWRKSYEKGAE
jgi:hypothetical protein